LTHGLPDTTTKSIFEKLIKILLKKQNMDIVKVRKDYLEPLLKNVDNILKINRKEFNRLKLSTRKWVDNNISEDELQ
jgi:fructose-1-phosphate kinase PfkB-like protein